MKILVTGPRGFIATRLLERFKKQPATSVQTLDRDTDASDLPVLFDRERFDAVVHLATRFQKSHEYGDIAGLVASNLTLTARLLDCAARFGTRHFITFGTYYELPAPASLYAATKAAMGPLLEYWARASQVAITELYLYDTYGPRDPRDKIVNHLIRAALRGEELSLSPGEQRLKLLYVDDVCSAIEHALQLPAAAAHDVARYALEPLEAHTLREVARVVEGVTYQKLKAKWGEREYTPGVAMEPALPFPPLPGWKAQISLAQGLVEVAKHC